MTPEERLAEIAPLQQVLTVAWPLLKDHVEKWRSELVLALVSQNNDETRGKIKCLDELLELPYRLQSESMSLQHPQQEAELP